MITKPRLIKVLIAGLCAVFFPVVQAPVAMANTCTTYSIGYQGPLTGPEAGLGTSQLNAVKFALTKFKAANSSSMLSTTVATADDQGDPSLSANAANSLINNPCVIAVVGPAYSGASRVALPLYLAAGMPMITPSATNETIAQYGGNIFHRSARMQKDVNLDIMRDVAAASPGATIAYFYDENYYSPNWITSGFAGITVTTNSLSSELRAENAISIKAAYDAGARYFLYDGLRDKQNIQDFAQDVKTLSSSNKIIFSSDVDPVDIKDIYTTSLNGSWFYPATLSFSTLNSTLGAEFATAYPGANKAYVTEAFDAAYFFFQAIASGADTRAKVNTYISTKKMAGLAGNLEFKADGDRDFYRTPQVVLSNGNLTITNSSALGINGNYQVTNRVSTTNYKLKILDWDDSAITTKRHVIYPNHIQTFSSNDVSDIYLPDGETTIEVLPDSDVQDPLKRRFVLKVTMAAGQYVGMTYSTTSDLPIKYSRSGDLRTFSLGGYNFIGTISDTGDFKGGGAVISSVSGSTITGLYKIPITSGNKILANLDTSKTYQIDIYPNKNNFQYNWKTTWSNISFAGASTLTYSGALQASNIFGKVSSLPSSGASVKVLKKDSSNNWVSDFSRSISSDRDFGFYVPPGTEYKIQAVPNSNEVGPVTTDVLVAPASGTVTLPDITFSTPNVSGTLAFGSTKFAGKGVYAYRTDDDSEAFNGKTDSNGVFRAFLAPGTYYIYADQPDYLYAAADIKCVVVSTTTPVVCDLLVRKKNVTGQVTVAGVGYRSLVSSYKFQSNDDGNYGEYGEDYSTDDGSFALDLNQAGTYQFSARRVITSSNGDENYVPLGFADKCTVSTTASTCNVTLTPNFKVSMVDSSGNPLSSSASISFIVPITETGVVQERFDEVTWRAENNIGTDGLSIPNGTHYFVVNTSMNYGYRTDFGTRNFYKLVVASGQVSSLTTLAGQAVSPVNGSYVVRTKAPNLKIRTLNGQSNYNNASIQIISRDGLGNSYYWTGNTNNFEFKLPTGVFDLQLRPNGSEDPPMGLGKYVVTVDSQGVATVVNSAGTSVNATVGVFDIALGTPNLTGTLTLSGTGVSGNINWSRVIENKYWASDDGTEVTSSGKFGGTFEPGTYRGIVYTYANYQQRVFVTQECVVPTTGAVVCNISIPTNNLKFRIKNSSGTVVNSAYAQLSLIIPGSPNLQFGIKNPSKLTGYFDTPVIDGSYQMQIRDNTGNNEKKFTFTVANGAISNFYDTVTKQNVSLTGDAYELEFQAPNIKGSILDSTGNALAMAGKGLDISIQKYTSSNWNHYKNIWLSEPTFAVRIDDPGTYRLVVNPYDFENYSLTTSTNFYVNSSLEASTSEASGFATQLTGFNVQVKSNNFIFKVLNPIDEKPIAFSRIAIYKQDNSSSESYYSDKYVYAKSDSLGGQYLAPGSYRVVVEPINQSNLDERVYLVSVDANEAVTVTYAGSTISKVSDRYVLYPNKANVFGRLYDSANNVVTNRTGWINIQLQQKTSDGVWKYLGKNTQVSQDGYFGMRVTEVGTYRLAIQPYERSDIGLTFSSSFDVTTENLATFSKEFSALVLNAPNIKITVGVSAIASSLVGAHVNVNRLADKAKGDYLWWDGYSSTPENGIAGFYLPYAGEYQIVVRPNTAAATAGATAKTYRATATEGSDGKVTVVVATADGASTANGVTRLVLGVANIKGTVTQPDSATAVAETYVVPIKVENGDHYEVWEKSTSTDVNGNFALTLDQGTYKIYARAPWNSLLYGDSKIIGEIVVDAAGVVTSVPVGKQALSFIIPLSAPTWSGVVKNPAGTEVVDGAWLCLNYRSTANSYRGDCKNTDSEGRFAFTLPDGALLDSNSSLDMNAPNNLYPNRRLSGQSAIEAFLGTPGSGKVLLFPSANVKINVTADGVGVPDTRVEVLQNGQWIGNQSTNSSGRAEFYSSDITSAIMAQAWVGNSASALNARFVTTKKDFSANDVANATSNVGVFTGNIALAVPNIKGVVRLPSVNGVKGAQTRQAYINVYDRTVGAWVSWTEVSEDGTFALFLKGGCCESKNYTLVLEPYWDASATNNLVRKEFDIVVSTTNVATITDRATGLAIPTETLSSVLVSTFVMGTPNVVGSVVNPSGVKVRDVGVQIYGEKSGIGTYTSSTGDFKGSLENGTYTAQAGMWGNNSGFAASSQCAIEIAENKVKTPGAGCVNSDGTLRLALRAANFTFTLKNNSVPIQNAHVSISIGGFHTWAYPDATGKVSLFVDDAVIAAQSQNYGSTTFAPHIYVYPYGDTNGAIEYWCSAGDNKPICSQLGTYTIGTPWADKHLGDIQVLTSNIKIKIMKPNGTEAVGEYAYAEVLRIDRGYDEWVAWGRTDYQGLAGFYIETGTALAGARFKIRVIPPWQYRSIYSTKVWDNSTNGYTYDQLNNLQLALGTPNLKVSVVSPNGSTPNKWGWSYLEEVNTSNVGVKWVDSTGLDEYGKTAYILEASKRYRLVAYPAGGRSGSVTSCLIQSDSATALSFVSGGCVGGTFNTTSEMTLVLARGNVIGTVYSTNGTTPVEGAIIYANIVNAQDEKMAVTSCTLADGTYGITLDPNYQWNIKIFPVNKPGVAIQLANKNDLAAITPPAIGDSTTLNVTLSAKP